MAAPAYDRTPERRALIFLRRAPLERRKGRWRFGAAFIRDSVVARLVAAGHARIEGDYVHAQPPEMHQ